MRETMRASGNWRYLVIIAILSLSSCSTVAYRHARPVFPQDSSYPGITAIDTVRPTFEWADLDPGTANCTYTLAIWEGLSVSAPGSMRKAVRGDKLLERQGISGTRFVLDIDLTPNRHYFWSVKRDGTEKWATSAKEEVGILEVESLNELFLFFVTSLK